MATLKEEDQPMTQHRVSFAIGVLGVVALATAALLTLRGQVSPGAMSALDAPMDRIHLMRDAGEEVADSSLDPEAVRRLSSAIHNELIRLGIASAETATRTAVEYTLGVADKDIDRLAGLALEHGAQPSERLVAFYRGLADARPDRLRPRDLETWNAMQVLRWGAALTSAARWQGVAFDRITAERLDSAERIEALFDLTPPAGSRDTIGYQPMTFPRAGVGQRFQSGELAGILVTIPVEYVNGDRSIVQTILVEYEPGRWYPSGARVTIRENPDNMPAESTRRPRPM